MSIMDWSKAPDWATYVARDEINGTIWWFEGEPLQGELKGMYSCVKGNLALASEPPVVEFYSSDFLERRPKATL